MEFTNNSTNHSRGVRAARAHSPLITAFLSRAFLSRAMPKRSPLSVDDRGCLPCSPTARYLCKPTIVTTELIFLNQAVLIWFFIQKTPVHLLITRRRRRFSTAKSYPVTKFLVLLDIRFSVPGSSARLSLSSSFARFSKSLCSETLSCLEPIGPQLHNLTLFSTLAWPLCCVHPPSLSLWSPESSAKIAITMALITTLLLLLFVYILFK